MAHTEPRQDVAAWKKAAFERFESYAGNYAARRDEDSGFVAQLTMASHMLRGEHGRALDIGCANGGAFPMLRAGDFEVVGIDLSARMIAFAQERYAGDEGVRLSRGDIEFLPFATASFDAVTCLGVFEYLPDYTPALREIARVLRPGGLLVLSVPNAVSPYHIMHDVAQATVWRAWRAMKPMLRPRATATGLGAATRHRRCVPWRLRADLARCELAPERDGFANFLVYPLDWLWPRANRVLSQLLTRMSVVRAVACTGCQYMVAARRT